ncbi:hypothetical protein pb186bvf_018162 [Paramecium bursaria]
MKKSQKSELMTQASSTHTSESENKEVYKLFGRETALGKELFNLFNANDKPKIDYPKPKQKTKEEKDQEKIKEKKSCPQKTVVEYPAPQQAQTTYHPIDFIQRRKPEAEIRKEIEAYYEGRKFYRPNIKGRDRKQLIEELQRIFKYKRGGLPKGAELPEVKYEVNEDDAKTSAIRKTHKKNLHFTGLKQDNQSDVTTLQGDPIIELEILYTQIIKEIEERQEFLDEIQHLDEPKLKQKIKDEIIERVSELQKVQELRQKY